jgi:hypothetical protein
VRHTAAHSGGTGAPRPAPAGDAPAAVTITREALHAVAALAAVRLDGARELRRVRELDVTLQASQRLAALLADFTRHAIAEYRGSHSTWNVGADADAVFDALRDYALALDANTSASKQIGRAP